MSTTTEEATQSPSSWETLPSVAPSARMIHQYIVDRPFQDPATGAPIANLQRLETFGSPDIGWVDVVVDVTLDESFRFEPNVTPRWMWW